MTPDSFPDLGEVSHPWLGHLWADPLLAVRDLWDGRVWRGTWAKAPPSEFLLDVVPDEPVWKAKVAVGLIALLEQRRGDNAEYRRRRGLNAYVLDLCEAFASIYLLGLQDCAEMLRSRSMVYDRWLGALTISSARDPRLEFWRVLALCPSDASLLPRWVQWLRESGDSSFYRMPARYGSLALRALRALPNSEDDRFNLRLILLALMWRASDQFANSVRREQALGDLSTTWTEIRALYPRSETFWSDLEVEVLESMQTTEQQKSWLGTAIGSLERNSRGSPLVAKKSGSPKGPELPPKEERLRVAAAIRFESPINSFPKLRTLLAQHFNYARATGDSYFLIRTISNLGSSWLRGGDLPAEEIRVLERMTVDVLDWDAANPYVWMLWVTCLLKLSRLDVAEAALWDIRRRFPENTPCRVELARILMYGAEKRLVQAEVLLREAIGRERAHPYSSVELARLLMYGPQKRYAEAEQLLRLVIDVHPANEPSRVELARLLVHLNGDYQEGLALVRGMPQLTALGQDVLSSLQIGPTSADRFSEWRKHSELEFETIASEFRQTSFESDAFATDQPSIASEPFDRDISRLERLAFEAANRLPADDRDVARSVEALEQLSRSVELEPGIAALAATHVLWLGDKVGSAQVTQDVAALYPGSYGLQASALWWSSAASGADAWKALESRFFTRRAETLALRVLHAAYRGASPDPSAVAAFERWRDGLPALSDDDASQDPRLAYQHFIVKQVEQLCDRSDTVAANDIRWLGDSLTSCWG